MLTEEQKDKIASELNRMWNEYVASYTKPIEQAYQKVAADFLRESDRWIRQGILARSEFYSEVKIDEKNYQFTSMIHRMEGDTFIGSVWINCIGRSTISGRMSFNNGKVTMNTCVEDSLVSFLLHNASYNLSPDHFRHCKYYSDAVAKSWKRFVHECAESSPQKIISARSAMIGGCLDLYLGHWIESFNHMMGKVQAKVEESRRLEDKSSQLVQIFGIGESHADKPKFKKYKVVEDKKGSAR